MKVLGIRVQIAIAQWPENLKSARAGNYQVWSVGGLSASPDSAGAFQRYDSRQIGGQNMARVRLPAFDVLYDRLQTLPDGPERMAVFREAERIALAYMPYKYTLNRVSLDMTQKQRDRLPPPACSGRTGGSTSTSTTARRGAKKA